MPSKALDLLLILKVWFTVNKNVTPVIDYTLTLLVFHFHLLFIFLNTYDQNNRPILCTGIY